MIIAIASLAVTAFGLLVLCVTYFFNAIIYGPNWSLAWRETIDLWLRR